MRKRFWPGWVGVGFTALGVLLVGLAAFVSHGIVVPGGICVFVGFFLGIGAVLKSPGRVSLVQCAITAAPPVFFFGFVASGLG